MRLPVKHALPLVALILLAGCGGGGNHKLASTPIAPANGPAADYPMVIGVPFTIGDTTYTPADKLNYDAVGYASVAADGPADISGAHKTLPLPSYVEVTALASGKTVLLRLERRGPLSNEHLLELSPGAAEQLGITDPDKSAVRVRRVNPPEQERALLRSGSRVPARMDTPRALLAVLLRKLAAQEPLTPGTTATLPAAVPASLPSAFAEPAASPSPAPVLPAKPAAIAKSEPAPPAAAKPPAEKAPARPVAGGRHSVQVASFSTEDRAKSAAGKLGGTVSKGGRFWLARLGPFGNRQDAEAALVKARAAGYSDARIQRAD